MDLQRLTGRLKLCILAAIGQFFWKRRKSHPLCLVWWALDFWLFIPSRVWCVL